MVKFTHMHIHAIHTVAILRYTYDLGESPTNKHP